jgi:outer membrane protein assembly factor BamB
MKQLTKATLPRACSLVALLLSAATRPAAAQDWPQWRGPARDGLAPGVPLPDPWPKSLPPAWSVEVGLGYSSPVIAGDKVVAFTRQGEEEVTHCLGVADGKPLWRDTCAAPYKPHLYSAKHGKGPFATPALADGKVYTFGISGTLSCLDLASGKVVWRKTFAEQFKPTYPTWGASNSPLVEGGLCILGVGGTDAGCLAAFEKDTGKEAWTLKADGPGYGSPIAADLLGQRCVVTLTSAKVVGATAAKGKLLWEIPFKTSYEQNATTPVAGKDTVVFSGYNLGTHAYRLSAEGESVTAKKLWENGGASMFLSSPVLVGEHVYGLAQRGGGTLVCLKLSDGQAAWSSPGRLGEYVSLVAAGDKLLVLTTEGELLVVAADPSAYKEIARTRVTQRPTWSHLALTPGRLWVKDKTHLTCLALAKR